MNFEKVPQSVTDTVRMLSADAVEKAKSGHPGTPMGAAESTLLLWANQLRFNPKDPLWQDRDRFVLSVGHASMLLYSLLHLFGFDLTLDDIKNFRQWGSKTAGHPERGEAPGVEVTTGPLGQGVSNAVGLALGNAMLAARFNTPDFSPVNSRVFALVGDGCLMEGISAEAGSLAGHLKLGGLVVIYDSNRISIEGSTDITFTEDVGQRYESYGWQVLKVDAYDQEAFFKVLEESTRETQRPTLIISRSVIAKGAATKEGSAKAHGEALGAEELKKTKERLGWPAEPAFYVPAEARQWCDRIAARKVKEHDVWSEGMARWRKARPDLADLWDSYWNQIVPEDLDANLCEGLDALSAATRVHSGKALNRAAAAMPWLVGGSADLAGSNNSDIEGGGHIGIAQNGDMAASYKGRILHFGVREHAMGAVLNGLNVHGAWRAFGATFLQFSDYMRPAIRLAALMKVKSIFVFTHDSIFLGEDGPTHQPVEHVASLRLIPGLQTWRPADGLETGMAWGWCVMRTMQPVALCLTRQKVPLLPYPHGFTRRQIWKGGYVLQDVSGEADFSFVATGSEVGPCLAAAKLLLEKGVRARVVSMPCLEVFQAQPDAYQKSVLGAAPLACVEAGVTGGWRALAGPKGLCIGVDRFGASAPSEVLVEKFGFTPPQIAARVEEWLKTREKALR